jgi:hypothetical protein
MTDQEIREKAFHEKVRKNKNVFKVLMGKVGFK